jgi:AraC family transcriptional regulator of adaptative response/methylated-DNA-[protein]-cysteine methyltransferase
MLQHRHDESMTNDERWAAVIERDRGADGQFFYGVISTHVFCRPSCPSRRPLRERVRFFATAVAAARAGFRPCRRCKPLEAAESKVVSSAIAGASAYLSTHLDENVSLKQLARLTHVSPFHLQREFKRALGVSPREFQAAVRAAQFRHELRSGRDVTTAIHAVGYGSPSRVYEAQPTGRGVQPSIYRGGGKGIDIGYATTNTPLGVLLVAGTVNGICSVKLGDERAALERQLHDEFPGANLTRNRFASTEWLEAIVEPLRSADRMPDLPLDVRGTAFQWQVWRALRDIPFGETRAYSEIAAAIGRPTAVRAVARACATNPVCLLVPCHRVVPKAGDGGGYRWGAARKRRLLATEASRRLGATR